MTMSAAANMDGATGRGGLYHADIVQQVVSWCATNTLLYSDGLGNFTHAPVTLSPSHFPDTAFEYARDVQPVISTLIDKIARDRSFIVEQLTPVASSDAFVRRLLDMYSALPDGVVTSSVQLGILRSDYMLHYDSDQQKEVPLQIEVNTISSSFGGLSRQVSELHRFLLRRNAQTGRFRRMLSQTSDQCFQDPGADLTELAKKIPQNTSTRMFAFAISLAHLIFGEPDATVLFIVQPREKNVSAACGYLCCCSLKATGKTIAHYIMKCFVP